MTENIRRKVEDFPFDQLELLEDKINHYSSDAWKRYLHSMNLKLESEMDRIMKQLAKQMEKDAGVLISGLDESARQIMYEALGLKEANDIAKSNCISADCGTILPANISISAISEQLRKETKNMMLLSIPLFFVNPLLSTGNILIVRFFEKKRINSKFENSRTEIENQIESACFTNAENIVRQIEKSFDDAAAAGVLSVQQAYDGLTRQIEDNINELITMQKDKIELQKYLKEQVDIVFPEFLAITLG